MGATLHWREPPDRDARSFETVVEFGRGRRSGTGFMAYSERSGPGVLVLHPPPSWTDPVLDFARAARGDGFTVLVPQVEGDHRDAELEQLTAAADYLADNWHPRLGILGFGAAAPMAVQLADGRGCDAIVLCGRDEAPAGSAGPPLLVDESGGSKSPVAKADPGVLPLSPVVTGSFLLYPPQDGWRRKERASGRSAPVP